MNYVISFTDISLRSANTWVCPICFSTQIHFRSVKITTAYSKLECYACSSIFNELDQECRKVYYPSHMIEKKVSYVPAQKYYSGPDSDVAYKATPGLYYYLKLKFLKKDFYIWSWTCPFCSLEKETLADIKLDTSSWVKHYSGYLLWCNTCNIRLNRVEKSFLWVGLKHCNPIFTLQYEKANISRMDLLMGS